MFAFSDQWDSKAVFNCFQLISEKPISKSLTKSRASAFNFTQVTEAIQEYIISDFLQVKDIISLKMSSQKMQKKIEKLNHPSGFNLSSSGLRYIHLFKDHGLNIYLNWQKSNWEILDGLHSLFEANALIHDNRFSAHIKILGFKNFYEQVINFDFSFFSHCPNLLQFHFSLDYPSAHFHLLPQYCEAYNSIFTNLATYCLELESVTTNLTPLHADNFLKLSQCKKLKKLSFNDLQGVSLDMLSSQAWSALEILELISFKSNALNTIEIWKNFIDKCPKLTMVIYHGSNSENSFSVKEINDYLQQRNKS